jgi:outer membrane protein assembly factor BamB
MKNGSSGRFRKIGLGIYLIGVFVLVFPLHAGAMHPFFSPGDLIVSLKTGQVLWFHPDGSFNRAVVNAIPGKAEGMGFDAARNLYVTHYCADLSVCRTGNTVEKFNAGGVSLGSFGGGYNCNPESIVFDGAGRAYVGQADCTGDILQFDAAGDLQAAFDVIPEVRGSTRIDLAGDGCTMFYTSQGPNVKRFNICSRTQLSDFNTAPLPGGFGYGLRILPDGGVLVATGNEIVRLGANGKLLRTYDAPGEPDLWLGLDEVGDGTFWVSNYGSSNVYRFDLATGNVLLSFQTGSPSGTVKDVLVRR